MEIVFRNSLPLSTIGTISAKAQVFINTQSILLSLTEKKLYLNPTLLILMKKHCSGKDKKMRHNTMSTTLPNPARSTKCWTHSVSIHGFFLSYRVGTEGKKSALSQAVCRSSAIYTIATRYSLFAGIQFREWLCSANLREARRKASPRCTSTCLLG